MWSNRVLGSAVISAFAAMQACRVDEVLEPGTSGAESVALCEQVSLIYGEPQDTILVGPGVAPNYSVIWNEAGEDLLFLASGSTPFPSGDPDAPNILYAVVRATESTGIITRPAYSYPSQYFSIGDTLWTESELGYGGLYECSPWAYWVDAGVQYIGFVRTRNGEKYVGYIELLVEPITVEGFCNQYRYRLVKLVVADCPNQPLRI